LFVVLLTCKTCKQFLQHWVIASRAQEHHHTGVLLVKMMWMV